MSVSKAFFKYFRYSNKHYFQCRFRKNINIEKRNTENTAPLKKSTVTFTSVCVASKKNKRNSYLIAIPEFDS